MPELPEVETVVRTLEKQIAGRQIQNVEVIEKKIIEGDPDEFAKALNGQTFRSFARRGKYLLFYMDDVLFVSHLRMEGKYYLQKQEEPRNRHMHVIFLLDNGYELRYQDTRKFGRMCLMKKDTDLTRFRNLGIDALDDAFDEAYIYSYSRHSKVPVKTLLLNQSFVAGIGNIYADEILFACGIRPGRSAQRLTKNDCQAIAIQTKRILFAAIQAGGTTIRSYTSSLGVTGRFQLQCLVHEQKICRICGSQIKMKRIGGRSSYYCPICQKK